MTEQPWNQNFKHATGFGPEEEDFLCKNAIGFHLFDTQHTFFTNVWLDFIWKDFVLYWPPEDRSDEGLLRHCQVYPPGPSENRCSTILCSKRPHPVFIIPNPTLEERVKAKAIHVTKRAGGISISRNTWWSPHEAFLLYGYHHRHRHQSWSFPGPLGGTSSVKLGFVNLPVLPQKKTTIFSPDYDDLSPLPPHFLDTSSVNDTSHEQYHLDPEAYALAMAGDMENIVTAPRRHIYSYNPLLTFSSYIDDYLAETCMVALHVACPTHIIQHWNGAYFDKVPLQTLAFSDHFTIIDTNGIHDVTLDFCNCIRERPLASQLQRAWLFPMTGRESHTAVTMVVLEQFQMLTFMGKISAYKYYYSLVRLTDNTNTKTPSLKRVGIGNDSGGWKNAKPASCAVECLACPRPGINIPKVINPNEYMLSFSIKIPDAWLYTLYLGMDGNFHLERFDVSSEDKDPGLGGGLAYSHVATMKPRRAIIERRIELRILQLAGLEGLSAHDMSLSSLCPRLIYVLVKHESPLTVEMDFGYLSAIKHFDGIPWVVTSYNIACQWSINLDKCIEIYGDHMRPQIPNSLYLVPKFHLPGHIEECQEKYCMSFHTKVGNNDGEVPERGWAVSNGVAASMCEMGPGHRREKLDQHFRDYNWQKNIAQGNSMLRKLKDAVPKASEHEDRFEQFTKSLPQQDVAKWTEIVEAWEADRTKLNPFAQTVANKTEAAMRLQLAQEDAQDELAGLDSNEFHTTSPKDMISQGIQLEGSQRRIARLNKDLGLHSTDLQRAQVLEKSNRLRHHIESWFIVQEVHMPMAYKDSDTNILMQKERLKCHKITRDLNTCITQAKQYYRDVLGEWSWQAQLRSLEDSDVRRILDNEMGISEGNRTMSWIWYSAHLGDMPGGVEECLRIEWCKTCARAH
ncbi:hypothetical protein EDD18DRAFT_1115892 [Armillaria luteobubalina]|uniref:CxC2-like cysteine cluster KDZ transposase-associated domain-containing protein n=1 Tax=Armillaria luteobubalina TaxID=153913 RepID=A0AA39UEH5_9AGAR|nr:hypothetical protein EDD18DRAFT_1115892 [Armillaria luteobubalina]